MMPRIPLPPVAYSVYKRLLSRYNGLYRKWQKAIEENNRLSREIDNFRAEAGLPNP